MPPNFRSRLRGGVASAAPDDATRNGEKRPPWKRAATPPQQGGFSSDTFNFLNFPAPSGRITATARAPAYLESTGIYAHRRLPERGKGERMWREISPHSSRPALALRLAAGDFYFSMRKKP